MKAGPTLDLKPGQTLSELVYSEMSDLIRTGSWAPRTRLPSESELSRRFGMSRPTIRQALARLRDDGLIQSRQGAGSFVLGAAPATPEVAFPLIGSVADLASFLNFREGLEGETAAMAATHRSSAQVDSLRDLAGRLAAPNPAQTLAEDDLAFHLLVAEASGNPFYSKALNSLRHQMLLGMGMAWSFSAFRPGTNQRVVEQHLEVVEAIERRDENAARSAMRQHLRWTRARVLTGGLDDPDGVAPGASRG